MSREPVLRDVRDGVALVEYPEASEEDANRAAVVLSRKLRAMHHTGILDAIPAARTLCVLFDPSRLSRERLSRQIARAGRGGSEEDGTRRLFRIPVVYDGEDLADLARAARLSVDEAIRRHAWPEYRVAFLGFTPGFPYLTGLPAELHAPRLPRPRPRVPAGSVAIGGPYTGVYPSATPGGWRLIGRTSARLFDPDAGRPALLSPGDLVRFEPVPALSAPERVEPERPGRAEKPILRVLSPGLFTTIQGAPRHGHASFGVPAGGAMDPASLAAANGLVGNAADAPALEITLAGPELEALEDCVVALAGGDFSAEWNGKSAPVGEPLPVAAGGRIEFGRARTGARAYLAVRGGLEAPKLTRRIEAGDRIVLGPQPPALGRTAAPPVRFGAEMRLRVILGPQADHFSAVTIARFLASAWRVSSTSDRRGLRLEGAPLEHATSSEIPPEGTVPGSVQVPGNGLPIILGPDGPVTGGYAKIATVIGADLALLGQAAPGAVLGFAAVSLPDALAARREYD